MEQRASSLVDRWFRSKEQEKSQGTICDVKDVTHLKNIMSSSTIRFLVDTTKLISEQQHTRSSTPLHWYFAESSHCAIRRHRGVKSASYKEPVAPLVQKEERCAGRCLQAGLRTKSSRKAKGCQA